MQMHSGMNIPAIVIFMCDLVTFLKMVGNVITIQQYCLKNIDQDLSLSHFFGQPLHKDHTHGKSHL